MNVVFLRVTVNLEDKWWWQLKFGLHIIWLSNCLQVALNGHFEIQTSCGAYVRPFSVHDKFFPLAAEHRFPTVGHTQPYIQGHVALQFMEEGVTDA